MQTIQSTIDHQGVLTLRMNRPEVHNAFDSAMIGELTQALKAAAKNEDVRVITLTGNGSCFSAGADLNWMRSQVEASQKDNEKDALELARLLPGTRVTIAGTGDLQEWVRAQLEVLRMYSFRHPSYWAPYLLISSWL